MHRRLLIPLALLVLGGCGGGSSGGREGAEVDAPTGSGDPAGQGESPVPGVATGDGEPGAPPRRIKTISVDLERDGIVDTTITYDYDARGRVTSREIASLDDTDGPERVEYVYAGDRLVRKHSGDAEDVHVYTDGLLTMSTLHRDGVHTYRYDAAGRLIGSTGDDYFYSDDDCESSLTTDEPSAPPEFALSYAGERVDAIATIDGEYSVGFLYNDRGQVTRMEQRFPCDDELFVSLFEYDADGRADRLLRFQESAPGEGSITDPDFTESRITYDDDGRLATFVTESSDFFSPEPEITTQTLGYDAAGRVVSQDVTVTGQTSTFFFTPDQRLSYAYEDGACVVAYSSSPAKLALLDVYRATRVGDPSLDCGYPLDAGEL